MSDFDNGDFGKMKLSLLRSVVAEPNPTLEKLQEVFREEFGEGLTEEAILLFKQELLRKEAAKAEKKKAPTRTGAMRIVVLDKDAISRRVTHKTLENLGHKALHTKDTDTAWDAWKKLRPPMLLVDWEGDGRPTLDLLGKVRDAEGSRYTYLMVMFEKRDPRSELAAREAGADEVLIKPLVKEDIAARIQAGQRIVQIQSRDHLIFAMAKVAEARDNETTNHLERIRYYSVMLARAVNEVSDGNETVDQQFVDNIFLTSCLHDIGKSGIPDHILLKPGRLDTDEFEVMKTHCRIGHEALQEALRADPRADYLKMAAEIALSHHERYDGAGYPQGLKGKSIPLAARIVALCDVYDALVSKRLHKNAFSHDHARDIIEQEIGRHFDPMLVRAFRLVEKKFIEIAHAFNQKPEEQTEKAEQTAG
ncbi:MAG: HD domain-containing phosphohydrolase [Desulfatibacillaceae bacterium]